MAQTQPGKPTASHYSPVDQSFPYTLLQKNCFGENKALFLISIQKPGRALAAFVKGTFTPQIIYIQNPRKIIQMLT